MHLVSLKAQTVRIADRRIAFAEGETIHTENSYKYTVDGFRTLAVEAGWGAEAVWTDPDRPVLDPRPAAGLRARIETGRSLRTTGLRASLKCCVGLRGTGAGWSTGVRISSASPSSP